MARVSSTPWTQPSSPQAPWRALKQTSGFSLDNTAAMSRPASTRLTLAPSRSRASAQAAPETRLTSRSADSPPIRTATCKRARGAAFIRLALTGFASRGSTDAPDLPVQRDAGLGPDVGAHRLAQSLEIGGARLTGV